VTASYKDKGTRHDRREPEPRRQERQPVCGIARAANRRESIRLLAGCEGHIVAIDRHRVAGCYRLNLSPEMVLGLRRQRCDQGIEATGAGVLVCQGVSLPYAMFRAPLKADPHLGVVTQVGQVAI